MREFNNPAEFAEFLASRRLGMEHALHEIGEELEKKAKEKFGHYQDGWAQLAPETEEQKARQGFPADAPLLATGDLRESVGHTVGNMEVAIGSTDEKMIYHEFGTPTIPPRPVFGPLLEENKEYVLNTIAKAVADSFRRTGVYSPPSVIFQGPRRAPTE